MLISWDWTLWLTLVRCFDPVPSAISVSSETPGIIQTALICCSSTKADHHSCCASSLAKSSRVIDSDLGSFSTTIELDPGEWCFLNAQTPNIIDSFLPSISSEYKEMRLREYYGMTISSAWSRAHHGHNHPLSLILSISHIKQIEIITCQTATTGSTSINNHLHLFNIGWCMSSSGRGRHSFDYNYETI